MSSAFDLPELLEVLRGGAKDDERPSFLRFLERDLGLRGVFTMPQRVFVALAFDGAQPTDFPLEPKELISLSGVPGEESLVGPRDVALSYTGGVAFIPEEARRTLAVVKGARCAGTWICALRLPFAAIFADLSKLQRRQEAYATVIAPKLKLTREAMNYVRGAIELLRENDRTYGCTFADANGEIVVTRSNGQTVVIRPVAATAGGDNLRGVWHVTVLFDESAFFKDEKTGIVNDLELWRAVKVRLLAWPGALRMVISTPWAESGLLWDLLTEERKKPKPTDCLAVVLPSLTMRCYGEGADDLRRDIVGEFAKDRTNALREYCGIPFGAEARAYFDRRAIDRACTAGEAKNPQFPLPPERIHRGSEGGRMFRIGAGADLGFIRNASALAIVLARNDQYELVDLLERLPDGAPLSPRLVIGEFREKLERYGASEVIADAHERATLYDELGPAYEIHNPGPLEDMYGALREALHEGRLLLHRCPDLARQLREVTCQAKPGGKLAFSSPTWKDGRHGDQASALANIIWHLSRQHEGFDPDRLPIREETLSLKERILLQDRERHEQQENYAGFGIDPSATFGGAEYGGFGGEWGD